MTTQFLDNFGRSISLGELIGKGGEGSVYEISGNTQFVAKIYHQPVTGEKSEKLAAMVVVGKPKVMAFAAWPKATLHKPNSVTTSGIVLPRIKDSREIHELYSPQHRKQHYPSADWRFLIRVARNCAASFASLHGEGIVIGDVNQGNVFVSPQATVNLIDCDSFQIESNGRTYRCGVGVAHFVPPELQTANFSEITRSYNHDNFGLAILIFHLLLMGRHPFAGKYHGAGDMPIERAIREYRFAYGSAAAQFLMAPPPNSFTLAHLPERIGALFERAFKKGSENPINRPTATEWVIALEKLEQGLRKCDDDQGHYYPNHLRSCPWCEIVSKGGPNFFISVTIQSVLGKSSQFDLTAIWTRIEAVPRPRDSSPYSLPIDSQHLTPRLLPNERDDNRILRHMVGIVVVACLAFTLFVSAFINVTIFTFPIGIVFAVWWIVLKLISPLGYLKRERVTVYRKGRKELDALFFQKTKIEQKYERQFQEKYSQLEFAKVQHVELISRMNAQKQSLQQQVRQAQFDDYLRGQFISNAEISGIGGARIAMLESYGIETPYDIMPSTISLIYGFGPVMVDRLVSWRQEVEANFRFNPSQGVPQNAIKAVETSCALC